jgi:hypothetical protein
LQTFLIGPGTEGMALKADVPWRLSERVGSAETSFDLFARDNPDLAVGHVPRLDNYPTTP